MEDMLAKFKHIPSTCASDALDGMANLDTAIKPLQEDYAICGRAVTVQLPAGDNTSVLRAIREAKPGDILVIDSKGYTSRAVAGDFVVGLAHILGLGGMVVDGSIRDVVCIKNSGFPVFCRGITPSAGGKHGGGQINIPISCGGVSVHPGDIIIGDADGVVVIPQEMAGEVLLAAQNKLQKDQKRADEALASPEAARDYLDRLLK